MLRRKTKFVHSPGCKDAEMCLQLEVLGLSLRNAANEAIKAWLRDVSRITGLKPTPLAKEAGLAPSTLLRAMDTGALERRSIDKIVEKFSHLGIQPPPLYSEVGRPPGLAEPELAQITDFPEDDAPAATQGEWTIRTRALELAGYLPGDRVRADSAVKPGPRDVVVAQVIDHQRGSGETVLRLYDPPFLVTDSADPDAKRKPLLVDGEAVSIWGVVIRSVRERKP